MHGRVLCLPHAHLSGVEPSGSSFTLLHVDPGSYDVASSVSLVSSFHAPRSSVILGCSGQTCSDLFPDCHPTSASVFPVFIRHLRPLPITPFSAIFLHPFFESDQSISFYFQLFPLAIFRSNLLSLFLHFSSIHSTLFQFIHLCRTVSAC